MNNLFKLLISAFLVLLCLPSYADIQPLVNRVTYQINAEEWAVTNTAKVTVSVDAALDKIGLASINQQVIANLKKIADADWHISNFTRSQDKTGLETVHVEAEARLPETALSGLRDKAKSISKPGETYQVAGIDFSPSNAEMEQARNDLRAKVFAAIKQEIARLNQVFPDQHYSLFSADFMETTPQIPPGAMAKMTINAAVPEAHGAALSVNTKVRLTVLVVIASPTNVSQAAVKQ
jgi:hypothetical protein